MVLSTMLLILALRSLALPPVAAAGGVAPPASPAASSSPLPTNVTGLLTINPSLFDDSVPATATLGNNYTLRIQIQSAANVTLPVIVRVIAPVDEIFIHPLLLQTSVPAMGAITVNFTMVPFVVWHRTPINVTAEVWVWLIERMSTPQLFDRTSAYVYNINANSFPYLPVLVLTGAVVAVVLVVTFHPNLFRRGRRVDDDMKPSGSSV